MPWGTFLTYLAQSAIVIVFLMTVIAAGIATRQAIQDSKRGTDNE